MLQRIRILDTTLRDGVQTPGCCLKSVEKVQIAKALDKLGVDIIEAGFPSSGASEFNSVQAVCQSVENAAVCVLTRAVKEDIDIAAKSLEYAKNGCIQTGIGTSDYHINYKFKTDREALLKRAVDIVRYAVETYPYNVAFYCEDAGRTDNDFLARVVTAVIDAGATSVTIPDTVGYCLPDEYGAKFKYLIGNVPNIDKAILSAHCHNDMGLATANAIQAILNGARQVDVTLCGVGERAGNTPLEQLQTIIAKRWSNEYFTNIDSNLIYETCRTSARIMNLQLPADKPVIGYNVFAHASGIHQDGLLKHPANYEFLHPHDIGGESSKIVLSALSGRSALKYRLELLCDSIIEDDRLELIYNEFLKIANTKSVIDDNDLLMLSQRFPAGTATKYSPEQNSKGYLGLEFMKVTAGVGVRCKAFVKLRIGNDTTICRSYGNGPVDAAIKAIKKRIGNTMVIHEFLIQAIDKGSDDMCKVNIQIKFNDKFYYGFAGNTDIVAASVLAFIDAVNKIPLQ